MQFYTGLIALDYFLYPEFPYHGNGWSVQLAAPCHKADVVEWVDVLKKTKKKHLDGEVVITASTEEQAQRAADLIHSSILVLGTSNARTFVRSGEHAPIHPPNQDDPDPAALDPPYPYHSRIGMPGIPLACLIAASASKRLRLVYAMSKQPPANAATICRSPIFLKIMSATRSRLARLGLVSKSLDSRFVRVQKNQSKISGVWNPTVKSELEARLRKGHIDLKERCLWNLRGPRTRIELLRAPEIVKAAEWVRHMVSDGEIEVIDAINYISFLRSRLSAHRLDHDVVKLLSVYDVANAQFVARRLLLEMMGFWRYSESRSGRGK